jgi:hypothetical protein
MAKIPKSVNIKIAFIAVVVALVVIYSGFKLRNIIGGPVLSVEGPQGTLTVKDPLLSISGKTERISKLYLNDGQIFTDENGNFNAVMQISEQNHFFLAFNLNGKAKLTTPNQSYDDPTFDSHQVFISCSFSTFISKDRQ